MRKTKSGAAVGTSRQWHLHRAPFEQGEIGPELFRRACIMGLEGLVSKHARRPYSVGRCNHWLKSKNPKHPAYRRVQDQF
jgi:bifunctional non-homologous end joining protein LigD